MSVGGSSKLFLGGINYDSTDDTVLEYMKQFGEVAEAKVVTDTETGKSRGFAFVKFNDPEVAKAAVKGPAGDGTHTIDGRKVKEVKLAKEYKIFVGGIKEEMSVDDIKAVFAEFGTVTSVDTVKDKETGKPKGFAFVGYDEKKEWVAALKVGAHQIKGHTCKVKEAIDKEDRKRFQEQQQMYAGGDYGWGGQMAYGGYGGGYGDYYGQQQAYGMMPMRGGGARGGRGGRGGAARGGTPYGRGYGRGGYGQY